MKFFIFLLLVAYTNLSLALGLGEIDLKSNLGEPLLASVNLTDAESTPDISCFSISDISESSAFKKASVTLKQTNGNYLLTITTKSVITEPIVNLRISVQCEPQINRDYLLLLDPVAFATAETGLITNHQSTTVSPINNSVLNKQQASRTANVIAENAGENANTAQQPTKVVKKKKRKKEINAAQSANQKLVEAYTGKQQPALNNQPTSADKITSQPIEKPTSTDKPYLIISGGNSATNNNTATPSLSLRLETQIDLARIEPADTPLSTSDTLDEVTVMTNRLAHLEKQLVSLQTHNTQLLADVEKAKHAGPDWLQLLLIGLALLVTLAGAEWLRRKILNIRASKEAAWFDAGTEAFTSDEDAFSAEHSVNRFETTAFADSSTDETSFNNLPAQNGGFSNAATFAAQEKDDSGNVIDHADVFIEHGRPTLAIQLLQNHLSDLPTESPAVWLKLLKLLAKSGTEAEYDDAVIECNKYYNIKVRSFAEAALDDISSIEDHPEIVTRLEGVWGSQYAVGFLNDLIYNKRSQPRDGFEHNTFEELFFLKQIAEILELSNQPNADGTTSMQTLYQTAAIKHDLEKPALTPKLFANVKPVNKTEEFSAAILNNNFSSSTNSQNDRTVEFEAAKKIAALSLDNPPDPSYEVSMLFDTEDMQNTQYSDTEQAPDLPMLHVDEAFQADEIDFSIPPEKNTSELTLDTNFLNEEIILKTEENIEDVTQEQMLQLDNPDVKPQTKSKTSKQADAKTTSNLIEWDLPKLDIDKE